MSDGTVYERRRTPLDHGRLTVGAGLATIAGVVASVLTGSPVAANLTAMLGGVLTMVFGLVATERGAYGGRLHRLQRKVRVVQPPVAEGYRDAPRGPDLLVDGRAVPSRRAREVVVGHFANNAGGGQSFDFWPLYLVFDDHVVELDVFRDRDEALAAQAALAERLELPTRELSTGIFGSGVASGCLVGLVTIAGQLAAVIAGALGGAYVDGPALKVLLPSLMVLALWAASAMATRVGAARVRPAIDEEVRETFGLARPKVRVATESEAEPAHAEREVPERSEKERSA